MQQFESSEALDPSLGVDRHIRAHAQPQDEVDEQRHEDADAEPGEISLIRKKFLFLDLRVDLGQVLPECGFEVVVGVLVIESEVDDHDDSEEGVVEQVAGLGVVEGAREGAFGEEVEDDEGDDDVLPAEEDEEVGESVVEPSAVVQHQPVEEPELPEAEIAHHCC